ncbi:hypothetical protein ACIQF6_28205 [Kitasatospora sp. NPDC092948]|uniref:hypothetical protein n=1 Tax=Kitasatospora sp. NPDC092948 TaxID=3364088 RepID=UPI00382A85D2
MPEEPPTALGWPGTADHPTRLFASAFDSEPYRVAADLELLADAHDDTTDLEHTIAERWNELAVLASRGEDQPGHDGERWQTVETPRAPYLGPGTDSGPIVLARLRLGGTWTEIAAGFDMTTEQARAVLRHFADTMRQRYERTGSDTEGFPPTKHAAILALLDLGDDESTRPAAAGGTRR